MVSENQNGFRHRPNLVAAPLSRHHNREVAIGQSSHRHGHETQRSHHPNEQKHTHPSSSHGPENAEQGSYV